MRRRERPGRVAKQPVRLRKLAHERHGQRQVPGADHRLQVACAQLARQLSEPVPIELLGVRVPTLEQSTRG